MFEQVALIVLLGASGRTHSIWQCYQWKKLTTSLLLFWGGLASKPYLMPFIHHTVEFKDSQDWGGMDDDFLSPWKLWVHSICRRADLSKLWFGQLYGLGWAVVLSFPFELGWSAHRLTAEYKEKSFYPNSSLSVLFTATSITPPSAAQPRCFCFLSDHFVRTEIIISNQYKWRVCLAAMLKWTFHFGTD